MMQPNVEPDKVARAIKMIERLKSLGLWRPLSYRLDHPLGKGLRPKK